jgi:TolB protein
MAVKGGQHYRVTAEGSATPGWAGLDWSPDRKWIAYSSDRLGNTDIWTCPTTGGKPWRFLATVGLDPWMNWSPDGRRMVVTSQTANNWDIWTARIAGGPLARVVDWPTMERGADWSPEGTRLVFASERTPSGTWGSWNLYTVPFEGGAPAWLAEGEEPDWAPGPGILFAREGDLWRVPPSGGEPERLTRTPEQEDWPRWSPDGSQVLFTRTEPSRIWIAEGGRLWTVR